MTTQQKLDHSSSIMQRVLRLREHIAGHDTPAENSDITQTRKNYGWQMWQKSDFSAYIADEPEYSCK